MSRVTIVETAIHSVTINKMAVKQRCRRCLNSDCCAGIFVSYVTLVSLGGCLFLLIYFIMATDHIFHNDRLTNCSRIEPFIKNQTDGFLVNCDYLCDGEIVEPYECQSELFENYLDAIDSDNKPDQLLQCYHKGGLGKKTAFLRHRNVEYCGKWRPTDTVISIVTIFLLSTACCCLCLLCF